LDEENHQLTADNQFTRFPFPPISPFHLPLFRSQVSQFKPQVFLPLLPENCQLTTENFPLSNFSLSGLKFQVSLPTLPFQVSSFTFQVSLPSSMPDPLYFNIKRMQEIHLA
jgi:hypothetical protein